MVPFHLIDALTYAVMLGCEFYALSAMTRGGRGLIPKMLGLFALAAVNVAMEGVWRFGTVSPDLWIAAHFTGCWLVISGLLVWFSGDSLGRRLFLVFCYGTYGLGYASFFDVIVYRPFSGTGEVSVSDVRNVWLVAAGLAVVVFLNFAFVRWILPRLPRDGRDFRWRESILVAGVMFAAMFASCLWPVSVISAPVGVCVPFVLTSVAAWIVFPMVCGRMRDRQRATEIAHGLELMMAEVKVRRAAIDLARRLRHDQRHHRAQIAEYMLAGQYDRVFGYLKALDEEAQEAPTDRLIWCENETINAILSGASRRAAASGVKFEVTAKVARTVAIPDVDLVALVANLIENAIAACGEAQAKGLGLGLGLGGGAGEGEGEGGAGGEWRKVSVNLRQREHGLGITVTNPVPEGFALSNWGLPCAEPGVGLESIRRVVERYGGQWFYELNNGTLKCQVILMSDEG